MPISLLILTKLFKNIKIIFDIRGFWFDENMRQVSYQGKCIIFLSF